MKKRVFSLLLCLALFLSFMPTAAFAAPSNTIDKLEITIPALVAGTTDCDSIGVVSNPAGAIDVPAMWIEDSEGNIMNGPFVAGEEYFVFLGVQAKEDYEFNFSEILEDTEDTSHVTVHGGTLVHAIGGPIGRVIKISVTGKVKAEPASGRYMVTSSTLNVRDTVNGNRIGGLKYGDYVSATGKYGNWLRIDFDGGEGWVSMDYVERVYTIQTVKLSATTYTYDGKVKTPTVTVKDSDGKTLVKDKDYTVSYASGRKAVGTYKVTVKGKGKYSSTKTLTFKINPEKTAISTLTAAQKAFSVKWVKKTAQVSGYQIQYSTKKDFSSGNKMVTVKGMDNVSKTIKNLVAGKTYFVRVRTFKTVDGKNYASAWSAAKSVKTLK